MPGTFSVTTHRTHDLVHITMGGFFSVGEVAGLVAERDRAHTALLCAPNKHVTLVDIRDLAIQAQPVIDAFKGALTSPIGQARRLAFVTGKTLARMQIQRAIDGPAGMFFSDVAEARAWLLRPARRAV